MVLSQICDPRSLSTPLGGIFFAIRLMLIPVTFLVACYWKGNQTTLQQIVKLGAFYDGGAAAFLIWYALTVNVTGSHPVANSIIEQSSSMLIALLAAGNSWVLWRWHRRISRAHDA